ncbi:MAG: hypothetical protein IKU43_11160 [Clostridia bacterium]|nr:hypothetical protein [Clostridia bacterium]
MTEQLKNDSDIVSETVKGIPETEETFFYDIDDEKHYTSGKIKLPPNYTKDGDAVPLIVFIHGSAEYGSVNSKEMTKMYEEYYNYLRDCGYAVFDCYGFGTLYEKSWCSTFATPTNRKCYLLGIKYILDNYNVDGNNIFVSCKSLGGIQALSFYYDTDINIKAVGMLAPELNPLHVNMGYSPGQRYAVCKDLGFSEDVNNVLNPEGSKPEVNSKVIKDENYIAYITENYDKMCGWNPYFTGLLMSKEEKLEYSLNRSAKGFEALGSAYRISTTNRPLKIWISKDDTCVNYAASESLVKSLNNAGFMAELRTLPDDTGGHHSVDNDEKALKEFNVTTPLGKHYESVPTAYYELEKFFRAYLMN